MMQTVEERWRQMSQRERAMVLLGGVVIALSLFFVFVVDPLLTKLDLLERQTARKQKDLAELSLLSQEYTAKRGRLTKIESRMPTIQAQFSLLAFMEGASSAAQVRDRITGMQPQTQALPQGYQETAVDVQLEGVQLPELLTLLTAIDQAPYALQVRRLQIRPKFDDPVHLNATLRVLHYAKN